MSFASRQDAGRKLGLRLRELGFEVDLVAGLPRGGVIVAAEVADMLQHPLTVVVVRKIGHPWHREFAIGALAEEDVLILDQHAIASAPPAAAELEAVIAEEKARLREYCLKFQVEQKADFAGRRVVLVDDGLATGATAEAAVQAVRKRQARHITMAAPVASTDAWERLARRADRVVTCLTDRGFNAVGQYYKQFSQTTDEEVLALLRRPPTHYGQVE
jgi:putative phosphoribosyl transferase